MIVGVDTKDIYDEETGNEIVGTRKFAETSGCGCCSTELYFDTPEDVERIKSHMQSMVDVLKELCNKMDVDYYDYINGEV